MSAVKRAQGAVRVSESAPATRAPRFGAGERSGPFVVVLPYPPSVNHYWRRVGNRTLISAGGRRYAEIVGLCINLALDVATNVVPPPPHAVRLLATPPDRRRRDLDNLLKASLDPLYRAIGHDDSVIEFLSIGWRRDGGGPRLEVVIEPAAPAAAERGGREGGRGVICDRCKVDVPTPNAVCVSRYQEISRPYRCWDCEDTAPRGQLHFFCLDTSAIGDGQCQSRAGGEGE